MSAPKRFVSAWSAFTSKAVIAEIEYGPKGANPRFMVANLEGSAPHLHDPLYCARGEMKNHVKEQQLGLFADRTSAHHWWTNQWRLLLASLAYILIEHIRSTALDGTRPFTASRTWPPRPTARCPGPTTCCSRKSWPQSRLGDNTYRIVNNYVVDYNYGDGSSHKGWYLDLETGERVINCPRTLGHFEQEVRFTTLIPDSAPCGSCRRR